MSKAAIFLVNDDAAEMSALGDPIRGRFEQEYLLETAVSGEDALNRLNELVAEGDEAVALLLADQQMPGLNGIDLLIEAERLFPLARKVLLSDYADSEAAIQAINETTIDRYLVKPWQPVEEKLLPLLEELLSEWQLAVRLPAIHVRGIMTVQVARLRHDSNLHHAAEIVALSGVGDLMVVDNHGRFVGVLSEGDILRAALPDFDEILDEGGTLLDAYRLFLRKGHELSNRPIKPLVITDPLTLRPDDHVAKAATLLISRQIRRLPVLENGRLVGTVSRANICQAVVGTW